MNFSPPGRELDSIQPCRCVSVLSISAYTLAVFWSHGSGWISLGLYSCHHDTETTLDGGTGTFPPLNILPVKHLARMHACACMHGYYALLRAVLPMPAH